MAVIGRSHVRTTFSRIFCSVALAIMLFSASNAVQASEAGLKTAAKYAVMMDAETGLIMYEKDADVLMPPASMSKLMTVAMIFERLKNGTLTLRDEIEITVDAWRRGGAPSRGSTMFAKVHSKIPVKDILRGIIIQSGNDACIAVAQALGGTEAEFAKMMTARAREIGLEQSTFANATGLPDAGQRMTARELALLARHLIQEYPEYYPIFAEKAFRWNKIKQDNRNPLIHIFPGADGLKTGHTKEAGYGLVGSAMRNGRRIIMVVSGLKSEKQRAMESRRLMTIGFKSFVQETFFTPGDEIGLADVYYGTEPMVPLVVKDKVSAFAHRASLRHVDKQVIYNAPLVGPVKAGQEVGVLMVKIPGQADISIPVYTGDAVERLGFWGRWSVWSTQQIMGEKPPVPEPKAVKAYRRQE